MFHARWRGEVSKPFIFREPAAISFYKQSSRRYGITVYSNMNMSGRFVELQRLSRNSWVRVRRMRLVPTPKRKAVFATFAVRQRGLRLRIFVPEETAAPCSAPTATKAFTS
jgi:hypothetical protein